MHRMLFAALLSLFFAFTTLFPRPALAQDPPVPAENEQERVEVKSTLLKENQFPPEELEASNLSPAGRAKQSTSIIPGNVWNMREERARLKKLEVLGEQNLEARRIDAELQISLKAIEEGAQAYAQHDENGSKVAIGDQAATLGALVNGETQIDLEFGGGVRQYGQVDGLLQALALEQALQGDVPTTPQTPPPADDTKSGGNGSGGSGGRGNTTNRPPAPVDLLKEAERR